MGGSEGAESEAVRGDLEALSRLAATYIRRIGASAMLYLQGFLIQRISEERRTLFGANFLFSSRAHYKKGLPSE